MLLQKRKVDYSSVLKAGKLDDEEDDDDVVDDNDDDLFSDEGSDE